MDWTDVIFKIAAISKVTSGHPFRHNPINDLVVVLQCVFCSLFAEREAAAIWTRMGQVGDVDRVEVDPEAD